MRFALQEIIIMKMVFNALKRLKTLHMFCSWFVGLWMRSAANKSSMTTKPKYFCISNPLTPPPPPPQRKKAIPSQENMRQLLMSKSSYLKSHLNFCIIRNFIHLFNI